MTAPTPRNVLLTGGRAAATLELARMFWRAGHRVVMAEHIGWHLSRFSRANTAEYRLPWPTRDHDAFTRALIDVIDRESIDLLIPTCEEIYHVAKAKPRLPPRCHVFAPDIRDLDTVHNKRSFAEVAAAAGLRAPKTTEVRSRQALDEALLGRDPATVVLKPTYSRFAARAIIKPTPADALPDPTPKDPWLVQDYIEGDHLCTWGVAHRGRLTAHVTYPTRYTLGAGACITFHAQSHPAAHTFAATFADHLTYTGQLAFDLIDAGADGLYGIECNPRLTSGVHLFRETPALLGAFLDPDPDTTITPTTDTPAMLGVSMLIHLAQKVRTKQALADWYTEFTACREVVHDAHDPIPALWRYVWLAGIVARARKMGLPAAQAASVDMEWNGE